MTTLTSKLEKALPLLNGLQTGRDCEDYAYATGEGFQAMTHIPEAFEALRNLPEAIATLQQKEWPLGTRVTKTKGSSWTGKIVGYYSTSLTPDGYAVESENEPGSVQIYPRGALERKDDDK